MLPTRLVPQYLIGLVAISSLILMGASSLRHALLQSGALDLAVFDQWIYLLSQGLPPISSFLGFHVLGDHAAFILYPISLLYRLYPDIHWLLLIQAFALAMGAVPIYALSRQSGLSRLEGRTLALCYVLYPAVFNINFYADFRPEAIAVPAILWAMWAGIAKKTVQLVFAVALVLSCKEILSLTVIALGLWFWLSERRQVYGWWCVAAGTIWFTFTIGYLIPLLRNGNPGGLGFYNYLGDSFSEVALNALTNPGLIAGRVFLPDRLFYYLLLIAPVILGLHWRQIGVMIPALPMLLLNALSDYAAQRDLIHHYSLPIFPFVLVWLVRSLASYRKRQQRQWLKPRWLVLWAIIAFLALGKYEYFFTRYLSHSSNLPSVYQGIALTSSSTSVLTAAHLCPHLSHRPIIHQFLDTPFTPTQLNQYSSVLLDIQHPGQQVSLERVTALKQRLKTLSEFRLTYSQNQVFLFEKRL